MRMRAAWSVVAAGLALVAGGAVAAAQDVNYTDSVNQASQVDPPSQVARVSVLMGNVSLQSGSADFNAAELNYPMTTGDRLYVDAAANAELQTGPLALRLGQRTDLSVTSLTDALAQFGLAQGSLHLRSYSIGSGGSVDPAQVVELDTPNIAVTVLVAGDIRVDVDPNLNVTVVSVLSGQAQVDGNGVQQTLEAGERAKFGGNDPVYAQWLGASRQDGLDRFSNDREGLYEAAIGRQDGDLSTDTIGAGDLAANGEWDVDAEFGSVWFPTSVSVGWQPYTCGHWTYVTPWGWTWVECESWGFAPFHYGRWNNFGGRWGWIPGPRVVRPVYSPAQVVFIAGRPVYPGQGAVTAWIPLGPREVFRPWYTTSPRYVNRVNASNIWNRNAGEVRRNYEQRGPLSIYAIAGGNAGGGQGGFANRANGTVVVSRDGFSRGQRVETARVRVDGRLLAGAPVLARPDAVPDRPAMGRGGVQSGGVQSGGVQSGGVQAGGTGQGAGQGGPARALPPRLTPPSLTTRTEVQAGPRNAGGLGANPAPSRERQPPAARNGSVPYPQPPARGVQTGTGQRGGLTPIAPDTPLAGGPRRPGTVSPPQRNEDDVAGQPPRGSQGGLGQNGPSQGGQVQGQGNAGARTTVTPIAPNTPLAGAPQRPGGQPEPQRPLFNRDDRDRQPDSQQDRQQRQGSFPMGNNPDHQNNRQVEPPRAAQPQPVQPQPMQPQPRIQVEQPRIQQQPRIEQPRASPPPSQPAPSRPAPSTPTVTPANPR